MSSASLALMPGALARSEKGLRRRALRELERSELHAGHGADVLDHAGRGNARCDVRRAAEDLFAREDLRQTLDRLDAVLERNDDRVLADDRPQLLAALSVSTT